MSGDGSAHGIERLNSLPREEAEAELLKCCGSSRWAREVAARRPFVDADELLRASDEVWWSLDGRDWLEAFGRHPKIGERKSAAGQTERERAWSAEEQSGVDAAGGRAREELAEGNREYERRFGHIYLVSAGGKSADELLAILRQRLSNDPEAELRVAAGEQAKITRSRLRKLLAAEPSGRPQ